MAASVEIIAALALKLVICNCHHHEHEALQLVQSLLVEMFSGHRFKTINDFGFVALDILYTYPEDNGIYSVKATNKYGTDMVQTELLCRGKESVITASQLPEGVESVQQLQTMEDSWR